MSVIGGILLFTAGVLMGAGAVIVHSMEVQRAVRAVEAKKNSEISKLRNAYSQLQEETGIMQQASDCADAFRRGKSVGRAHPMSDAEQFARTFESRRVKFVEGTRKEAASHDR